MYQFEVDIRRPELALQLAKLLRKQADDLERQARKILHIKTEPSKWGLERERLLKALKKCRKKKLKNIDIISLSQQFSINQERLTVNIKCQIAHEDHEILIKQYEKVLKMKKEKEKQVDIARKTGLSTSRVNQIVLSPDKYRRQIAQFYKPHINVAQKYL